MNEKTYDVYISEDQDISKRELSNSENLGKAILTISTTGLAASILFIDRVVELSKALHLWILVGSWVLFILAIIFNVVSYFYGQRALQNQRELNERYYFDGDEGARFEIPEGLETSRKLIVCSVISYIVAILSTLLFVSLNLYK